jgi:hypothetical protein
MDATSSHGQGTRTAAVGPVWDGRPGRRDHAPG